QDHCGALWRRAGRHRDACRGLVGAPRRTRGDRRALPDPAGLHPAHPARAHADGAGFPASGAGDAARVRGHAGESVRGARRGGGATDPHRFTVRVYYEDTDFSGIVYHAVYLHFFERARTEFLRAIGVHHSELIREGIAFAVRSMQIDFDAAAHIDDMLEVETRVESVTPARLHLDQRITRDGAVITRARGVVVAVKTS